jgi:hypothetical protein
VLEIERLISVFRRILTAAALALSIGMATAPVFAHADATHPDAETTARYAEIDSCQQVISWVSHFPHHGEEQRKRFLEATDAIQQLLLDHINASADYPSGVNPNDPNDMPCAKAVIVLSDYVNGG